MFGLALVALAACRADGSTSTDTDATDGSASSTGAPTSTADTTGSGDSSGGTTSDGTTGGGGGGTAGGTTVGDTGSSTAATSDASGISGTTTGDTTGTEPPAVCGDGVVGSGEECDDGNQIDSDTCTSACKDSVCGDGIVQFGAEFCDDGNQIDNDECSNACLIQVVKYTAVGPQINVPQALLKGWEPCWSETYKDSIYEVAYIEKLCKKANLMLACRPVGAANFTVLAHAPRAAVLTDTGDGNDPTIANGTGWYWSGYWSVGFAPEGAVINRDSCDTAGPNDPKRLCWHTSGGYTQAGWRCGSSVAIFDQTWERVILQAD